MWSRVEGMERTAQRNENAPRTPVGSAVHRMQFMTGAWKALARSGGTPEPLRQILGAGGKSTGVSFTWLNVLVNIIWMYEPTTSAICASP